MITAPVKEVKIYRSGAVIKRCAEVSLTSGANTVFISGISSSADPDSLRMFFPDGVFVNDVQIVPSKDALDRLPSEKINDEIVEKENALSALKTVEELRIANGNFEHRGDCPNDAIEAYLEALPARLEDLRAKQRALDEQIDSLKKEKEKLEAAETFQAIRVELEAEHDTTARFDLEYSDSAAYWSSTYEIHTSSDSDELKVLSRARITQSTGEDWKDVAVSLYTGNPSFNQQIPQLDKMNLEFYVAPAAPRMALRMSAAAPVDDAYAEAGMMVTSNFAPVMGVGMKEAGDIDADTMTGYSLPGKRTVTSGGAGTVADLKTDVVPAKKRVVCVPKLDGSAYLAAMIKCSDWPLKPSSAKIYLNGNYSGETYVAPNLTEEIFMLSLGRDERVTASRKADSKTEDVLMRGQKRDIKEIEVRVSNSSGKTLTVLVWDQIPVSSDKQITVDRVSTDGASLDAETGKLNWCIDVEGKAAAERRLSYTVTYPKDKKISELLTLSNGGLRACPKCGEYVQGKFCPRCGGDT